MKKYSAYLILILVTTIILTGCFTFRNYGPGTESTDLSKLVDPEIWTAVSDSKHNINTDLCFWHNKFYLVYQSSEFHLCSEKSRLILLCSDDCRNWVKVQEFIPTGCEYRDPKFAIINDKLFLFILPNFELSPAPFTTFYSFTENGYKWSTFSEINQKGWLFWRPKTFDNQSWYVTAYWHEHGKCALFNSKNGIDWKLVSIIYDGETCDETALEFSANGEIFITARLEGDLNWNGGSFTASTLIAHSVYPYKNWEYHKTHTSRLDGPALWRINNFIFAAGRYEPNINKSEFGIGSVLNIKRTAVYILSEDTLIPLIILPSSGDTSYPGVAVKDGEVYISYYTNEPDMEYIWAVGCFLPTKIMISKFSIDKLEAAAMNINSEMWYVKNYPNVVK